PNSEVLPNSSTRAEPITSLLGGKSKKIDVVVSARTSGLQVGVSLKGMNFRDRKGLQFDKNLTGRTYELEDEVRFYTGHSPTLSWSDSISFRLVQLKTNKHRPSQEQLSICVPVSDERMHDQSPRWIELIWLPSRSIALE